MMPRKQLLILAVLSAFAIFLSQSVSARAQATYQWYVAAQATPDQCFQGDVNAAGGITSAQITANNASFNSNYPAGLTAAEIESCISNGYLPKTNQAYVWGLTEDNSGNLWIGTVANTLCLVFDEYYGAMPAPYENSDYVCDAQQNPEEDFKPPRMFVYSPATGSLTDLTSKVLRGGGAAILTKTFGLRSAGNFGGVVFFGGLETPATGSTVTPVVLFAFNAQTQAYLGSYVFDGSDANHPYYNNIRQWHVISNQLFTGVGKPNGAANYGAILRWTGTLANPFSFLEVGETVGQPAYFVAHSDGHIYATTWGSGGRQFGMLLYMSPTLGTSTGPDVTTTGVNWTPVWNLNKYEVEPTAVQLGGAIESFDGYLYFGTMQVPGTGVVAFEQLYPGVAVSETTYEDSYRAISIFRTKGFDPTLDPTPSVELLYGSADLNQYDSSSNTWSSVPNNMGGVSPTYGSAGFGNPFNNYTWSMAVFNNQLYVGTMDFSYLTTHSVFSSDVPALYADLAPLFYGADLWTFANATSAATAVNTSGMGNDTSYGIRTMVTDSNNLWIGMANPMNLRTDSTDNPGGWKLLDFPIQYGSGVVSWPTPAAIVYGTPLTATQLDATATVPGTFTYTPPLNTVLSAGSGQTLSVNFVPSNTSSQFNKTVNINVNQTPLTVTGAIVSMPYGTAVLPLSATLTGVVNNDDITAAYSTKATSSSHPGSYLIKVTLNDPDSRLSNYSVVIDNGILTITQAGTNLAITANAPSVLLNSPVTFTAHVASATTGTPTGSVTFMDGATALGPAVPLDANGNAQLTTSSLASGLQSVNFVYSGDNNFVTGSSPAMTETVQDFQFNSGVVTATVKPGGVANFSFSVAPTYGAYLLEDVGLTLSGLPAGATGTITPSTVPAGNSSTPVTVKVQTASGTALNRSFPSGLTFAVLFLPVIGLFTLRRRVRGAGISMMMLLGLAIMLGMNSCGSPASTPITTVTSQTYSITVSGVSGASGTLQHPLSLQLTVQ